MTIYKKVPMFLDRNEFLTPFDKLFDQVIQSQFPNIAQETGISFEQGAFPKVDVVDYDESIVIVTELPSMRKDGIKVSIEDDVLTISGDKHKLLDDDARYIRRELKHSSFKRSFRLGDVLDEENINATFDDGILRIEIPKKNPEMTKKLDIDIA